LESTPKANRSKASPNHYQAARRRKPEPQPSDVPSVEPRELARVVSPANIEKMEATMSFGKGALLWLIGIPLPIILLIAVFMHH
jgi:hypothetical protein